MLPLFFGDPNVNYPNTVYPIQNGFLFIMLIDVAKAN